MNIASKNEPENENIYGDKNESQNQLSHNDNTDITRNNLVEQKEIQSNRLYEGSGLKQPSTENVCHIIHSACYVQENACNMDACQCYKQIFKAFPMKGDKIVMKIDGDNMTDEIITCSVYKV